MRFRIFLALMVVLVLGAGFVTVGATVAYKDMTKIISDNLSGLQALAVAIDTIKAPELKNPDWLQSQLDAEAAAVVSSSNSQQQSRRAATGSTVTYEVSTRGTIAADLSEFKSLVSQTLNDSRGWNRLGVSFQEVASGGSFTLVLSEAIQVPYFSSVCSSYWSCSVGNNVVINQDRWLYASDAWNGGGGSLRDYRNMVVNHETGHWLGHRDDNYHCGGAGQPAPLMQQQSINLLGCSFNPWPLDSELWSSTLGI